MKSSTTLRRLAGVLIVLAAAGAAHAEWNLGPEEIVQAAGADIAVPGYSVPSLADWDSDGRLDLVVGEGSGSTGNGRVRVYLNVGSPAAPAFADFFYVQSGGRDLSVEAMGCLGCFPRVVHWDDDGRKDLLLGTTYGNVFIYLNVGSDTAPEFGAGAPVMVGQPGSEVPVDIGSRATPSLVDWNADGRRDLISGCYNGWIHVFLNEGTDSAPVFLEEILATTGAGDLTVPTGRASPVVCDLDGDGCKDILAGNTEGQLYLFVNTGTDSAPVFGEAGVPMMSGEAPIDLVGAARSRPSVGDWSGDGRLDVLIGADDGRVHLFQGLPPTAVAPVVAAGPLRLLPPWPNPANPRVSVTFELARPEQVRLAIWDVRGRRVADLATGRFAAGEHTFAWDGGDRTGRPAPSGTYLARLEGGGIASVRKIELVR